jgi:hypothetical protein
MLSWMQQTLKADRIGNSKIFVSICPFCGERIRLCEELGFCREYKLIRTCEHLVLWRRWICDTKKEEVW